MKISEIFESLQGEGKYAGSPALFIRLSGCTRNCSFCDTKYHSNGQEYSLSEVIKIIKKSDKKIIIWTGGEPLIQIKEILKVIRFTKDKLHHMETNGDLLKESYFRHFDYICISPKDIATARSIVRMLKSQNKSKFDVKIVTDLDLNKNLIEYATMLLPLTTYTSQDESIKRKVWEYCVKKNLIYSPRLHNDLWGKTRSR